MKSTSTPESQLLTVTRLSAILLAMRGAAGLVGTLFNIHALLYLVPAEPPVTLITIICYLALGFAIWQIQRQPANAFVRLCGTIVMFLAFTNIIHFVWLAFPDVDPNGRIWQISLPGSISLFISGLAILLIDRPEKSSRETVHVLMGCTLAIALTSLIGYTYGFSYLTTFGPVGAFRIENALLIVLSSVGLICARPNSGVFSLIASPTSAGRMARILLPAVILVPFLPIVPGLGRHRSNDLLLLLNLVLYGLPALILSTGKRLENVENQREQVYEDLQTANEKLRLQLFAIEHTEAQLRESLEIRNQFLANFHHELRTPINGFLGVTQLLLSRRLDASTQELVAIAHHSAEDLLSLVNKVLTFSDLEQKILSANLQDFDLDSLVSRCRSSMSWLFEQKRLQLSFSRQDDVPAIVRTDEDLIEMMLKSLLENALEYTESGTIAVTLSINKQLEHKYLRFEVEDSGIGMSSAQLARVTEPFEKGDLSFTRAHGGIGLGLAIVKKIVDLLDGQWKINSTQGSGTTIVIDIPLLESIPQARTEISSTQVLPRRILIAEDNVVNAKVLQLQLSKDSYESDIVKDGAEAVAAATTGKYGLVLMDVQMPHMDGLEATRQIRRSATPASTMPIVAVTAHATEEDKNKCLAAGMSDFVSKPVRTEALNEVLTKWLSAKPGQAGAT